MILLIAIRCMGPFWMLNTLENRIMIWTFATGPSMRFCNKNKQKNGIMICSFATPPKTLNVIQQTKYCFIYFLTAIVLAVSFHFVLFTPYLDISFYLLLPHNTTYLCVVVRYYLNIRTSHGIDSHFVTRIYYT